MPGKYTLACPVSHKPYALARWLDAFARLTLPTDADWTLLVLDISYDAATHAALAKAFLDVCGKFKDAHFLTGAQAGKKLAVYQHRATPQTRRVYASMAETFNLLAKHRAPGTDLCVLEDDIIPAPDALVRLCARWAAWPSVTILGAAQPDRSAGKRILAWKTRRVRTFGAGDSSEELTTQAWMPPWREAPASGMEFFFGTATGLCLIRGAFLDRPYVFRSTPSLAQDVCACKDAAHFGGKIAVDWSVRVGHIASDGKLYANPGPFAVLTGKDRVIMDRAEVTAGSEHTVAVVVPCYGAYVKYLPECCASIDAQTSPATQKILVTDTGTAPPDWTVIRDGTPEANHLRNVALARVTAEGVVTVDADNWLRPDYLAAIRRALAAEKFPDRVGIMYADIEYRLGAPDGKLVYTHGTPRRYDHWRLRRENYISAASWLRTAALRAAGGWQQTTGYDDWAVSLAITDQNWAVVRQRESNILAREGMDAHRREHKRACWPFRWLGRTYAIVTLQAGKTRCLPAWAEYLTTAKLPPRTALYVVDNSRSPAYHRDLMQALSVPALCRRFEHIDVTACGDAMPPGKWGLQYHVAALYNSVLPRVKETMVFTLEDDNVPAPDTLRALVDAIPAHTDIAGCGAPYLSRHGGGRIVASVGADYNDGRVYQRDLTGKLMPVKVLGFGATVWNNGVLRQFAVPFRVEVDGDYCKASDTVACADVRRSGFGIALHSGTWCDHRFQERA